MQKDYRHYIIKTLETLEDSHGYIFAELLNLASTGEMKDIMSAFEEGDMYDFKYEHFEDLQDANIQKLLAVLKHLEQAFKPSKRRIIFYRKRYFQRKMMWMISKIKMMMNCLFDLSIRKCFLYSKDAKKFINCKI